MKVSIGSKIIDGPYGGGNLFVRNLALYLTKTGNCVTYNSVSLPDMAPGIKHTHF